MKNGSKVGVMPDKNLKTLTDDELNLGHNVAMALMKVGIPAAVDYAGSGIVYDGRNNFVERRMSITWLTCKGEAVITSTRSADEINVEQMQTLANGIAQNYQQQIASAFPKQEAANDSSSVSG